MLDEVSTIGAASFEIISRRLEQVAKALWRQRNPGKSLDACPEDFGGFGGMGVICMGDFAQLPPIEASCLLRGGRLEESFQTGLRASAMQGREQFGKFTDVIRLRRIHRQ